MVSDYATTLPRGASRPFDIRGAGSIQAKRWEGTVGRPEIQKFVGALHGKRVRKGVFITTGAFSADAREYVSHIDPRRNCPDVGKQILLELSTNRLVSGLKSLFRS